MGAVRITVPAVVDLQQSTADPRVDRVVRGVMRSLTSLLPDQVLSCYLLGSHAESTSHAASDVDLAVILSEQVRKDLLGRVVDMCTTTSPIHLDIMAVTPREFIELYPGLLPVLKVTGRRVWGADLAAMLPWPDPKRYTDHSIELATACMAAIRNASSVVRPLDYPDPAGEFFGYDSRIAGIALAPQQRLRGLTALVARTAIAYVGVATGRFCTSREEYLRLYREASTGRFADLIEQITSRCRGEWHYDVPGSSSDRADLRDMCREVLDFERCSLAEFDRATQSRIPLAL